MVDFHVVVQQSTILMVTCGHGAGMVCGAGRGGCVSWGIYWLVIFDLG